MLRNKMWRRNSVFDLQNLKSRCVFTVQHEPLCAHTSIWYHFGSETIFDTLRAWEEWANSVVSFEESQHEQRKYTYRAQRLRFDTKAVKEETLAIELLKNAYERLRRICVLPNEAVVSDVMDLIENAEKQLDVSDCANSDDQLIALSALVTRGFCNIIKGKIVRVQSESQ